MAERAGYDWAWVVEHHFMKEYSPCSAPVLERTPVGYEYYAALRQLRAMLGGEVTFEFLERKRFGSCRDTRSGICCA